MVPGILKPDVKALVWMGIGYFALGKFISFVKSRTA